MPQSLSQEESLSLHAYWRAANYLSIGQIYLRDNPLLREPLRPEHIKPRLLGHWGTTPGLNFIYAHLNRIIRLRDANLIYICGPGHGGPGMVANTYLEGTYSEIYPDISLDYQGLQKLFLQFSWPGGIPSHASPETPGSINEGGELGYSVLHAYGAAFDNPDLIVACVVGDGEAETGPCAASWHSNKFLDAETDGAVLPILHLNGYKIANPTMLARIPQPELLELFRGYGYDPVIVDCGDPLAAHPVMASALDAAFDRIAAIQRAARVEKKGERPCWPMIILRSPKGWTGPKMVDGKQVEGTFRSHQVPLTEVTTNPQHLAQLESWMHSYKPAELFDEQGRVRAEIRAVAPDGDRRMGANPHANGGRLMKPLVLPDFRRYAIEVKQPGGVTLETTAVFGKFLRDVFAANRENRNFRLMGPDETASNRLQAVFEVTDRAFEATIIPGDDHLAHEGRVMEVLSEHMCQGWLEGYNLTGRHGLFSSYEAFIQIVSSMFNQHAKWLGVCRNLDWRAPVPSFNYLLSSHVWRQDHNGFSHQDPGFIDHVMNKKPTVVRVYLAPDANTLLSVADHCLRSRDYVNVIVAGKQPSPQWLSMEDAVRHCAAGAGIWEWAGSAGREMPDVVFGCAGDVATLEVLAASAWLRQNLPELRTRVVNVVDLMRLQPESEHPHGMSDPEYVSLFTDNRPVIFAYHGYPWLIHRLTYRRPNHDALHVRGYKEEGSTTTPFDMVVRNNMDRFQLAMDAIRRSGTNSPASQRALELLAGRLAAHHEYVRAHGEDLPEVRNWVWPGK